MSSNLYRFLILICLCGIFIDGNAQERRVSGGISVQSQETQRPYVPVFDSYMVDVQPEFPGGEGAMIKFINETRNYPIEAYHQHIQGRVVCSFIVNADGTISYISVVKGVEESLNKEAIRIISQMPRWIAGRVNGKPVSVYCIVSIPFRL